MNWSKWCGVLLCSLVLYGCGKPEPAKPQATDAANSSQTEQEPAFDLAAVKQQYQGVALKVLDISERSREARNALAVTLSVPLDPSVDHQRFFIVNDDKGIPVDGAWELSRSGKIVWFNAIEPAHRYQVAVRHGLIAANGASLADDRSEHITTRDLKPSVAFNTPGSFLPKGLSGGLPVQAVNVEQVDIDFFRIEQDKTQAFLSAADNYYWRMSQLTRYGKLVYSGRYAMDAEKNTRAKRNIDVGIVPSLQQQGLYLAVMRMAGNLDNPQTLWFSVTDLGLHARFYHSQTDVYVSSLKTGKALADVEVSLYGADDKLLKTVRSNGQGVASFSGGSRDIRLVVAQSDQQYSLLEMRKPALDLSEFDLGVRPQRPIELFVYAPRDLYRPGESVDFNALVRDFDGKSIKAPVLNARLIRPDGAEAHRFDWYAEHLGYYYNHWQIPKDAPVGNWQLRISGPLAQDVVYGFKVEEFLPERMKLTFNHGDTRPVVSDGTTPIAVPVKGEYLYGAPGSGNRLSTMVRVTPWRSPVDALPNYEFGDARSQADTKGVSLDDISLDALGQGLLKLNYQPSDPHSPLRLRLTSSLYESGGRPVTRSYSSLIWPAEALLGVRSNYQKGEGMKGPTANSKVRFDIVKASLDGVLHQAKGVEVELIREDRQYFWVYNDNRGWHYEWTDKEYVEASQSLDIAKGHSAAVEFPVEYGSYRLEVKEPGTGLLTSVRFFAGYNWYAHWRDVAKGSDGAHPDKVTLALDKQAYRSGETAKVTIVPPEAGEAIILVEGERPLWLNRQWLNKSGTTVEIPIDDNWQSHDLYISAVVLRPEDKRQSVAAIRSFGLIHLPLERSERHLKIDFDVPEKWLPGQQVDAKMSIKGAKEGEPVFVTLAAVDVGVLSITDFTTPDPFDYFFGRRAYTIQSRDLYDQVIVPDHNPGARLRYGGDSDLARGGEAPQSDVHIVSLFHRAVEVHHGKVSIPLTLPDFNGRLRLMAVAFSDARFASAEQEVTVATPVVTQMAMPRFLAYGDRSTLALDINNLSGSEQQLEVTLSAKGPVKLDGKPRRLVLADQQKQTLLYTIDATAFEGQAEIEMQVSGIELEDQHSRLLRQWTIGLRPAYPAITKTRREALTKGQSLELASLLDQGLIDSTVQARLSLFGMVDLDLAGQFKQLLQYPYGCLEQTGSRAYVLTYADKMRQQQFNLDPISRAERLKRIDAGIERLASLQLKNGGFGLWSNTSAEEHWLSAYVADFLLNARDMGVEIPKEMLHKVLRRLRVYLNRSGQFVYERYSDDSAHYNFAYKAYAGYVLARVNQANLGSLRRLFDRQMKDAVTGLPKVQLGLALLKSGDKVRGAKAIEQGLDDLGTQQPRRQLYLGDYGSAVRDSALAIHLLLSNGVYAEQAKGLSLSLAKALHRQSWLSTQERNALFLAGIALASGEQSDWAAKLMVGAAEQSINGPERQFFHFKGGEKVAGVAVSSMSNMPVFVTAQVQGYSQQKPAAMSEGLKIQRRWFDTKGNEVDPEAVKVGDLIVVKVSLSADKRTPDALVVDLLPAGFELENQNLAQAVKLDELTIDGKPVEPHRFDSAVKHMEYRDDRFVAALDLRSYGITNVYYLLRAVTPGTYKVPPPMIEDMYAPQRHGIGDSPISATITNVSKP